MRVEILDIDLSNLQLTPKECLRTLYWELGEEGDDLDPFFQKEEWFSSTLLEWGRCGKLLMDGDGALGFTQYAPPTLFPRLRDFAAGRVSDDAAYLSYCFVVEGNRGRGLGTELIRAVARDVVERGYLALEAVGDRDWDGTWVLPEGFLSSCGFRVAREDPRYPLMRLDIMSRVPRPAATERVELPLPALEAT